MGAKSKIERKEKFWETREILRETEREFLRENTNRERSFEVRKAEKRQFSTKFMIKLPPKTFKIQKLIHVEPTKPSSNRHKREILKKVRLTYQKSRLDTWTTQKSLFKWNKTKNFKSKIEISIWSIHSNKLLIKKTFQKIKLFRTKQKKWG